MSGVGYNPMVPIDVITYAKSRWDTGNPQSMPISHAPGRLPARVFGYQSKNEAIRIKQSTVSSEAVSYQLAQQ